MNFNKLKGFMMIHGDTAEALADAMGIHVVSLYNKMRNRNQQFTLRELDFITKRYNLTPKDLYEIFFREEGDVIDENNG